MLLCLVLAYAVCVVALAASAAPALPGPVSSYEPYPKLNPNSAWQLEIRASAKQKKPIEFAAYPCIAGNCTTAGDVAESGAETVVISAATTAAGDAVDLTGCIAVVQRSSSKLITDIHQAQAAGAAAVLIINDDAALPLELSELHIPAYADAVTDTTQESTVPCLLVPREAAAALTGSAVQVRLVQGGASTPFTESVSRAAPVCYVIHNALQHDEAEFIKRKATPRLRPSYVGTSGQAMRPSETRTSNSTFLMLGCWKPAALKRMQTRLSKIIGLPRRNFFDLQVNRYKPGGKYDPHYDWAPSKLQEQAVTCLLCLSAVDGGVGGETTFPLATPPARIRAHKVSTQFLRAVRLSVYGLNETQYHFSVAGAAAAIVSSATVTTATAAATAAALAQCFSQHRTTA
eukprot:12751-Heterococcus_DN1.PRE.1